MQGRIGDRQWAYCLVLNPGAISTVRAIVKWLGGMHASHDFCRRGYNRLRSQHERWPRQLARFRLCVWGAGRVAPSLTIRLVLFHIVRPCHLTTAAFSLWF